MPFPSIRGRRPALRAARAGRARLAILTVLATLAAPATAGAAGYVNPFAGDTVSLGRTDMGVDLCLVVGQPIRALGDGVVTGIMRDWYARQPYVWYELTDGPDAGRYVYVAEQIDPLATIGQTLHAGDVIGRFARRGSCLETGWSQADGATVAQSSPTGYTEGAVTAAGIAFARLLISLGVPGTFELAGPTPPPVSARRPVRPAPRPAARPVARTDARRARPAPRPAPHRPPRPTTPDRPVRHPAPIPAAPPTVLAPPASVPAPAVPAAGSTGTPWWDAPADPFAAAA